MLRRDRGFDHTTQGAYAAAAGVAKALGLSQEQTANAIAISGTANLTLRVTRTGVLSHWKGLAYPNTAMAASHAALLAAHGISGPEAVFEGNKGFKETVAGPFEIDWLQEGLERVCRTILKKHNAEIHAQSALDAALDIRSRPKFDIRAVRTVRRKTFEVAYKIIGGEEGDKRSVRTKEEADHSLPYLVAVALLDGEVTPAQYAPERIVRADVQSLLRKVMVRPDAVFSARFPEAMPCRIRVRLGDGRTLGTEQADYPGFYTRPLSWEQAGQKFHLLAALHADQELRRALVETVQRLEAVEIRELTALLGRVQRSVQP